MNLSLIVPGGMMLAVACVMSLGSEAAEGRRNKADASAARPVPAGAAAAASPANSFEPFAVIAERNIFNPNRTGRTRTTPEEKPPRVDEITLVGTMEYEKGRIAFFESTDAAFRKTAKEGDAVADFTVQRIAADGVDLTRGEAVTALRVAQQLRRPEGGEWTVTSVAVDAGRREGGAGSARADRGNEPAGGPAIPADASEVLKRLMRQREKQLKE
jgi:hypothetical protein